MFPPATLSFEEFAHHLRRSLGLDSSEHGHQTWARDTKLEADLHLDSVERYELLVVVEELGAPLADVAVNGISTLGDFYDEYRKWAR